MRRLDENPVAHHPDGFHPTFPVTVLPGLPAARAAGDLSVASRVPVLCQGASGNGFLPSRKEMPVFFSWALPVHCLELGR